MENNGTTQNGAEIKGKTSAARLFGNKRRQTRAAKLLMIFLREIT